MSCVACAHLWLSWEQLCVLASLCVCVSFRSCLICLPGVRKTHSLPCETQWFLHPSTKRGMAPSTQEPETHSPGWCLGDPQFPWGLTLTTITLIHPPHPEHLPAERGWGGGRKCTPPQSLLHIWSSEPLKRLMGSRCFLLTPHCFASCLRLRQELAPLASHLTPLAWTVNRPPPGHRRASALAAPSTYSALPPYLCPCRGAVRLDGPPQRCALPGSEGTDDSRDSSLP